jgi:hypothetical protein
VPGGLGVPEASEEEFVEGIVHLFAMGSRGWNNHQNYSEKMMNKSYHMSLYML